MAAAAAYRFWKHVLLWGGVLLLLMARVPLLWTSGEFVSEDGWVFFAEAFNSPWTESLFTPFAGYFRLEARLFAELVSGLPWLVQPYVYALGGLALNALALALFYAPGFRYLLPTDAHRALVVLLMAAAPNAENLGLVTGQHWYLAFGLTLLLVMDAPSGQVGRALIVGLSSIAVWSSPSVLVLWPLLGYLAAKASSGFERQWKTAIFVQLTLAGLAVLIFRGTEGARAGEFSMWDVVVATEHLLMRGWLVVGMNGRWLAEIMGGVKPWLLDIVGVFTAFGVTWIAWENREDKRVRLALLLIGIGGAFALASLWRTAYIAELARTVFPTHERYLTASTLLLILGASVILLRVGRPSPRWLAVIWAGQMILFVVGWSRENHWARSAGEFRFRDYVEVVDGFAARQFVGAAPESLYVPASVPYWGLVLEIEGGKLVHPDAGVLSALPSARVEGSQIVSEIGAFTLLPSADGRLSSEIKHEWWGHLTFSGVEAGRIWFVDGTGIQLFTSELLYPYAWRIAPTGFTLVSPPH